MNETTIFVFSMICYLVAFVAFSASLSLERKNFYVYARRINWIGMILAFCALGMRWYSAGHPPLSNMYESLATLSTFIVLAGAIFTASLLIYEDVLRLKEKSLAGCRLFFPPLHAIYKFWDAQDKPGLWVCFGPFQLHLSPQQVFSRVALESEIKAPILYKHLLTLREGIEADEFAEWPEKLRTRLLQNNMVATPGEKKAWLHPRISLDHIEPKVVISDVNIYTAAALIIEKIWDESEYLPEMIAQLPDFAVFSSAFSAENLPTVRWQSKFSADEAGRFIADAFWEQHRKECGQISAEQKDEISETGIGVETADEQIDSEEGEHRDDEPCY